MPLAVNNSASKLQAGFLFLVYTLVLLSPNWILLNRLIGSHINFEELEIQETLQTLVLSGLLYILFCASCKKLYRIVLITFPFFLIAPFELFHTLTYRAPTSSHIYGIIGETNIVEATDYLSGLWLPALGSIAICISLGLLTLRSLHKAELSWNHRSRWWILLIFTACLLSFFGIPGQTDDINPPPKTDEERAKKTIAATPLPYILHITENSYPFGLPIRYYSYYSEQKLLYIAKEKLKSFHFGAKSTRETTQPETYILVIGESSRADHWQLNGYERPTNPRLISNSRIINFRDMLSPFTATRASVPVILTRKPVSFFGDYFPELSVVSAFKEAGFKTYWLSTQQSVGRHDTVISLYASEADVVRHLNPAAYGTEGEYDGIVLPTLASILKDSATKKFIVIHTLGSHWRYTDRTPESFDQFIPTTRGDSSADLFSRSPTPEVVERYRNSYDNTILYTDYILDSIIQNLKETQQPAMLLYVSDHGEDLPTVGPCLFRGHGNTSRNNFHIPGLAWASSEYEQAFPGKVKSMKDNAQKKLSTTNVFYTLLDVAGLTLENKTPAQSFASKDFREEPRIVSALGLVNFDQALFSKECQAVVKPNKTARNAHENK